MKSVLKNKEEGMFGEEAVMWFTLMIAGFFVLLAMNHFIALYSWRGFTENMKPSQLYPHLINQFGLPYSEITVGHGFRSLVHGAIWLQENIVLRYIVGGLLLLIILFVGVAYLYYDLFEQYLNTRLKTFLPRIVFGVVLAYFGIYILEALMYLSEGAYSLFYNLPSPFSDWEAGDYFWGFVMPSANSGGGGAFGWLLDRVANLYLAWIWVFIVVGETVTLLVLVAVRDFLFSVLLVLLPISSLLLIHPWTQRIGSRLWWLTIDLVFLPLVMIIPLSLLGFVHNSISFTIAGLTITIGSLYLIAQEPFVLSGAGFTRGGSVLSSGIMGGAFGGSVVTAGGMAAQGVGEMHKLSYSGLGKLNTKLAQRLGKTSVSAGGGAANNMASALKGKGGD